ncbi:MAG: cation:proton antiporter, partial [Nakamurella sp.]
MALTVPVVLKLAGARAPAIVFEILLGIVIGPQVTAWARVDEPVQVLAMIGLAFLLLLSGLEIEFDRLRGQLLRVTSAA